MKYTISLIICALLITLMAGCTKNPLFTLLQVPSSTATSTTTTTTGGTSYIGNVNTFKFHKTTCGSLPDPVNRISFSSRAAAVSAGYIPCGICKP